MLRLSHALLAKTLVVTEVTSAGTIAPATLSAITAAVAVGGPVTALVAGTRAVLNKVSVELAAVRGVTAVLQSEGAHYDGGRCDEFAELIDAVVKAHEMTHVIAGCTAFGKDVVPLSAAKQQMMPITDVLEVKDEKTFVRPMYAGNVLATIESDNPVQYLTVRSTAFERAASGPATAVVSDFPAVAALNRSRIVSTSAVNTDTPDLTTAAIVVSGGRGLKSKENFDLLHPLAKKLNAAVGATRAAVDAGFTSNEHQVGQTGKNVAPSLYMAIGISGAIQHVAGMRDSKVVVAVNTDEESPIFQAADFTVVGDAAAFVKEMTEKL